MKYAMPGLDTLSSAFRELVVVPVKLEIKNCIPGILPIVSSNFNLFAAISGLLPF